MAIDQQGYVGNFYSLAEIQALAKQYPSTPLTVLRFLVDASSPLDTIWVISLRESGFVAFASNSRARACRYQESLANVGMVYSDDCDYWMQPANSVQTFARQRLQHALAAASAMELAPDLARSDAEMRALLKGDFSAPAPPGAGIHLLDYIETAGAVWSTPSPPPADPAEEAAAEARDRLLAQENPRLEREFCERLDAERAERARAEMAAQAGLGAAGASSEGAEEQKGPG